jgi:hypothetical protein
MQETIHWMRKELPFRLGKPFSLFTAFLDLSNYLTNFGLFDGHSNHSDALVRKKIDTGFAVVCRMQDRGITCCSSISSFRSYRFVDMIRFTCVSRDVD